MEDISPSQYLHELQKKFQIELEKIDLNYEPRELYEPIQYALKNGGKRLRPLLVLLAADFFNARFDDAMNAAIAVEIFHNFTLVHDDIMDRADLRRGQPSVFKKYGLNSAILSGDTMFAHAYKYVTKISEEKLVGALKIFNQISIQVCEGQQMDMNFEERKRIELNEYLKMIELKTAVVIGGCLKLGAFLGESNEDTLDLLYNLGLHIGLLFQIQDDWMDVYGDEVSFGKKKGNDIIDAKKTILYVLATKSLTSNELEQFIRLYHNRNILETEKIELVKHYFNRLNIEEKVFRLLDSYRENALNLVHQLDLASDKKNIFVYLLNFIFNRKY
ncbi:MAG: polyprenyl synthetase family protein [Bacteroidales bacterium]|nr:polyprenyl synthetase family protein [Bacteroidales bacterium]